ncbi:unnamed protein product [Litomosoides sigmodontis]|uniref:Calx-beta domain-containing protein n=1 Tax=Litomosoides sigmodontis TaxID=42156 RepID=A0A3P6UAJ1_LITSI|nr:unnamed protein product [Litomosoides sigmodontis]
MDQPTKQLHFIIQQKTAIIQFKPGEKVKEIHIDLVEGATWRPGDVFYVCLKLYANDHKDIMGETAVVRVQIFNDTPTLVNKPMIQYPLQIVKENQKYVQSFVTCLGQRNEGTFNAYYETEAVTAKRNEDYEEINNGVLTFMGDEYEKYIDVRTYDDMDEEKDETFNIHLTGSTGGKYYSNG